MDERYVFLDLETTGLKYEEGCRIIEIGCCEVIEGIATGNNLQIYINPGDAKWDKEAIAIHGLTSEFLADKPTFPEVASLVLDFINGAVLVGHSIKIFDRPFLNLELLQWQYPPLSNKVIDTYEIAREKFPNQKNSLDALCDRYNINRRHRTLHGALLDAKLLAAVYQRLVPMKAFTFDDLLKKEDILEKIPKMKELVLRKTLSYNLITPLEEEEHNKFIKHHGCKPSNFL